MIKIRIGKNEQSFDDHQAAMRYVSDKAGDTYLEFQRLIYEGLELVEMDYLTYYRGRVSETYSTRKQFQTKERGGELPSLFHFYNNIYNNINMKNRFIFYQIRCIDCGYVAETDSPNWRIISYICQGYPPSGKRFFHIDLMKHNWEKIGEYVREFDSSLGRKNNE